jgi:DNA-binding MarR family transcriptional regulator
MRRSKAWAVLRHGGGWMRMSERAVFYALLERSDNADCTVPAYMTPSLEQLAEAVCCSKSTAAAALDHLDHHGWVVRKRSKGGRSHKTTYQLTEGVPCYPECEKRSGYRTVSRPKQSDSRTPKQSDSHMQNRRSDPVFNEGIREGEEEKAEEVSTIVSLTERPVCPVAVAPAEGTGHTSRPRLDCDARGCKTPARAYGTGTYCPRHARMLGAISPETV